MKITTSLDVRFRKPICASILALLGGAWLAGCADQASVNSSWQPNAPRGQSYRRVLVVGLTKDYNQRCAFEYSLVSQLNSDTPIAGASCDFLQPEDPLTRSNIEKAVAAAKADAVLTTRVVDSSYKAVQGAGMDAQGGAYYKTADVGYATAFDGGYGVAVVYGDVVEYPPITTVEGELHLLTRVYDTRTESMVYTVQTKAGDIDSEEDFLLSITPAIADRLRRDGLIP